MIENVNIKYDNNDEVQSINKFLLRAQRYALDHVYDPRLTFRHCAVLVSGGSIISIAYNFLHITDIRFDSMKAKICGRYQNANHAECAAILKVADKKDLCGTKLYIVRISRNGKLQNSRPCGLCRNTIIKYGISRVFYSISDGEFGVWNSNNFNETNYRVCNE